MQAQDNITNLPLANGWGEKHRFYVKWKYIEAKVSFFYFLYFYIHLELKKGCTIVSIKGYLFELGGLGYILSLTDQTDSNKIK